MKLYNNILEYIYIIYINIYFIYFSFLFFLFYITGRVSFLHGLAIAVVFPSEQHPYCVPAHPPIKLSYEFSTSSKIEPEPELSVLLGIGTIPYGQGLVDTPSAQHPYWVPRQPPTFFLPSGLGLGSGSGQGPGRRLCGQFEPL